MTCAEELGTITNTRIAPNNATFRLLIAGHLQKRHRSYTSSGRRHQCDGEKPLHGKEELRPRAVSHACDHSDTLEYKELTKSGF
jgi:hypothetical protein